MTEALDIRTPHADVSDVVRELAPAVDDLSIRLPCEHPIAGGDWVRFTVRLADGSAVFEGVGRSEGTRPDGPRYRVHLSLLSFDARNEIMYERMLLARDAAEETGTLDLNELGAELVRGPSRSKAPPPPPKTSTKPSTKPPPPPARKPSAIPPPRSPLTPSAFPRSSSLPPRPSAPPKTSAPLARPAPIPKPSAPPPRKPSAPAPSGGAADTTRVTTHEDAPLRLEVAPPQLALARTLAAKLPVEVVPLRAGPPEQAVLETALRIGLATLRALADEDR